MDFHYKIKIINKQKINKNKVIDKNTHYLFIKNK